MHRMSTSRIIIVAALLFAFAGTARTQDTATRTSIHSGDVLQLRFWPDNSLSGEYSVLETGRINIPLIGEVVVAGATLDSVLAVMRDRYRETTENGVVTGNLIFRVSVLGAVHQPGIYPSEIGGTLFELISAAGGFGPTADLEAIRIVRNGQTIAVNATDVYEDGAGALLVPIQSGDRVVVPARRPARLTMQRALTLLQTAAILTTIILQVR